MDGFDEIKNIVFKDIKVPQNAKVISHENIITK